MSNFSLLFRKSTALTKRQRKQKKKLIRQTTGIALVMIQMILSVLFVLSLFNMGIIPEKYIIIIICLLVLMTIYNFMSQFTRAHAIGKILSVLLCVLSVAGNYYSGGFSSMLKAITKGTDKTDVISVFVLKEDKAKAIEDAADYTFGYNGTMDTQYTRDTLKEINKKTASTVKTRTAKSWEELIQDLYGKNCQAILLNDAYQKSIVEQFPDFMDKTRVIFQYSITTQISAGKGDINVKEDSFIIFISGNDQEGKLLNAGLSDVNIMAVINPETRQILLVSTPRDSYLPIINNDGVTGKDKLTHAGNFGIDGSIRAIENLYGVDINYYAKINFSGTITLVDALGGITVNSEIDFYTHPDTAPVTYHFVVGPNDCDGEKALAFCRERMNIPFGDLQRGRDQMIAIQAMVRKACSPAILTRYADIMGSISEFFVTNMPQEKISSLIKHTLDNSTPWNVQIYNIDCTTATMPCYFFSPYSALSVDLLDYDSVNTAIEMIAKIKNDEIFNVEAYVKSKEAAKENASSAAAGSTAATPRR